jgi:hypothetical protein
MIQDFYLEVYKTAATAEVLHFIKVDLMQQIWLLLLDDKFVNAYIHSILVTCGDGKKQQVFPHFFTYVADYPEK